MSVRLSCPSCNTHFALEALPASRRGSCPRCGDVFPIRGEVTESEESSEPAVLGETPAASRPQSKGLTPARAILVALSLGFLGLAAGLVLHFMREPKSKPEPQPQALSPLASATPPAQLAGLGYLPAECNIVFAVQPGPILTYAERTKQDPRALLARAGVPPQALTALDLAGLPLTQIDHLAAGAFLGNEGDELRLALALVLRQPLTNEGQFLMALQAKPILPKENLWSVTPGNLPLILAKVSPTVWVFGLTERDLVAVDRGGFGPGGTQLRGSDTEGMRKMLASVPADAAVWVTADDERDWTQKPLVKLAAGARQVKLTALKEGRGGVVAIRFGERPRLRLFARCADDVIGARFRAYLQTRAAEMEGATAGGGGAFALFDAPFDPTTIGPPLRRMLDDVKK